MFTTFYHASIRKYIVAFGTLFNNIYIERINANNEPVQLMKVPLSYGPKEKFIARAEGDPELNRPFAMVLPRMAFELATISYDSERKLNTMNQSGIYANSTSASFQYQSVPYNLGITLNIMTKNADDATRIVEQVLPYFTPDWTVTLDLIPEIGYAVDVPVVLTSTSMQDTYEGDFTNRRVIVWSLGFVMKGQLYGPIKRSGPIKRTYINYYLPTTNTASQGINNTQISERTIITPGLLANGDPTIYPAANTYVLLDEDDNAITDEESINLVDEIVNPLASIDSEYIDGDDDFGFIIEFEGVPDLIVG